MRRPVRREVNLRTDSARDPVVGRRLALLHGRVAHPWTIADLADEVGISRSALVERFS